jgi:hypothetical protein
MASMASRSTENLLIVRRFILSSILIPAYQGPGGDTSHDLIWCHIPHHRRSSTNHGPVADVDALPDASPSTNMGPFTYSDRAGQYRASRHMRVVHYDTVMFNYGATVDDGIPSDARSSIHDASREELCPFRHIRML